jgi:hypothetical protein
LLVGDGKSLFDGDEATEVLVHRLIDCALALSAGYQLHLAKPVEPDDLVTAILNLIGRG